MRLAEYKLAQGPSSLEDLSAPVSRAPVTHTRGPGPDAVKSILPWLVAISFFMESLDITILNTSVPTIAGALGVSPLAMRDALMGYALSLALFIPLSGWIADRFGTRRVFAAAVGTFTLGSLLCGLALNLEMLVLARILQGIGGAMMIPVGRIALARAFDKAEMLRVMTYAVVPGMVGPLVGPVAGGLIISLTSWRAVFLVNLPMGLLGLYVILKYMPDYRGGTRRPMDWLGFLLFGVGVAGLCYGLDSLGGSSLFGLDPRLPILASLVLLGLYGLHALRHPHPMLSVVLLRIRTFRVSVLGGFISRLGTGGMSFFLPLFYQVGLGRTPMHSAILILPQPLAAITSKFMVTRLLARFGYRRILVINTVLIGLVQMSFATIRPETSDLLIMSQAFLYGLLISLHFSSINTLQYADLPTDDISMGSSIGSVMQQLSLSFGVALAMIISSLLISHSGTLQPDSGLMASILRETFLALGFVTIASTLLFRGLLAADGRAISGHELEEPSAA